MFNPVTQNIDVVGGHFLAAAVAGVAAANSPYVALTNKDVQGFWKMNELRTRAQKMDEARNGVMVIEDSRGKIRVFHGLSTDTTSVNTREYSVVFAKDRMMQTFRDTFDDSIIGQPITPNTVTTVKAIAIGVLELLQTNNYIYSYQSLVARQNALDPTMIEVKFEYKPTYPLNYVYIQFGINLETGEIELL
jgi:hypothetical protein